MTDPADATPAEPAAPEDAPTSPAARGGGSNRWLLALAIGALVVAVAAAALSLGQSGQLNDLKDDRNDRREVTQVATEFGAAYLTYDYDDIAATDAAVTKLATEDFAKGFKETASPGIKDVFASQKTSSKATVQEVFVGDVDGDKARALVVVDVAAKNTSTGDQELSNLSFVIDLVRVKGQWLVDAVAPAPQPDISNTGATSTSTTVAPTTTAAP